MEKYHKIYNVFKRQSEKPHRLLSGQFSKPEFGLLANNMWRLEEKIDGTNIRLLWQNNEWKIKGKSDSAQIPTFLYDAITNILKGKDEIARNIFEGDICLYGEGFGKKVQKVGSKYLPDSNSFVLFDVKVGNTWLTRESVEDIGAKLGIDVVPVYGWGTIDEAINMVKGGYLKSHWGDFIAEGVVAKVEGDFLSRTGERVLCKIKSVDFCKE